MSEIAKLIGGSSHGPGYLDDAAANRTVDVLMAGKGIRSSSKKPSARGPIRSGRRPASTADAFR
jgi:hypothetical protein